MLEVQDVFLAYADIYRQNHKLSFLQHKAVNAILNCRISALGGHTDTCPNCGDIHISYNSCRNRHCPKCQTLAKERWIDNRKADLLNVGYFHVVCTFPHELNTVIYSDQKAMYHLLFKCVTETLRELAADRRYLGADMGLTAVLHTWEQNFCFHPHIHCIVPAGGLNKLGKWVNSKKKFFLSHVLGIISFKRFFLACLRIVLYSNLTTVTNTHNISINVIFYIIP